MYAVVAICVLSILEISTAIAALWYRSRWKGLVKLHTMVNHVNGRASDIYPFEIPDDTGSPTHKQRIQKDREAAYEQMGLLSKSRTQCERDQKGTSEIKYNNGGVANQVEMKLEEARSSPILRQNNQDEEVVILDVDKVQQASPMRFSPMGLSLDIESPNSEPPSAPSFSQSKVAVEKNGLSNAFSPQLPGALNRTPTSSRNNLERYL